MKKIIFLFVFLFAVTFVRGDGYQLRRPTLQLAINNGSCAGYCQPLNATIVQPQVQYNVQPQIQYSVQPQVQYQIQPLNLCNNVSAFVQPQRQVYYQRSTVIAPIRQYPSAAFVQPQRQVYYQQQNFALAQKNAFALKQRQVFNQKQILAVQQPVATQLNLNVDVRDRGRRGFFPLLRRRGRANTNVNVQAISAGGFSQLNVRARGRRR